MSGDGSYLSTNSSSSSHNGRKHDGSGPKDGSGSDSSSYDNDALDSQNQSAATLYSMGAMSIISIVGVIGGVCAIVIMFVLIGRKKFGEDEDDPDEQLIRAYACRLDAQSLEDLSPTFLQTGEFDMTMISQGSRAPDLTTLSQPPENLSFATSSDEQPSELQPFDPAETTRAYGTTVANILNGVGVGDLSSVQSSSVASEMSEGWSSVMGSESSNLSIISRCTRDTNLSVSTSAQQSECRSSLGSYGSSIFNSAGSDAPINRKWTVSSSGISDLRDHSMRMASSFVASSSLDGSSLDMDDGRSTDARASV